MDTLLNLLQKLLADQSVISIILSDKRKKGQPESKAVLRPVIAKDGSLFYQAEKFIENKAIHQNFSDNGSGDSDNASMISEIIGFICEQLEGNFKQMAIFSIDADYQILASKPETPKIIKKSPTKKLQLQEHNREKQYIIPDGTPCDFLVHLGVMSKDGKVLKAHYNKFRQINRFLEIVDDVAASLPKDTGRPLRIIDFGCGKAYLTFALYHYLHVLHGQTVEILGLDLKADVIDFCSGVARDLGYDGLSFIMGDIADYKLSDPSEIVDMVVTLHACDTATDYALINAARWGASVILSVPCCQHEINGQLNAQANKNNAVPENINPTLFMLKHGIIKERFASLLTDSLRTLKLESAGYDITMIEFTSLEHTAKNIMIRAIKAKKPRQEASAEYDALKEYWNVSPTIDGLTP